MQIEASHVHAYYGLPYIIKVDDTFPFNLIFF